MKRISATRVFETLKLAAEEEIYLPDYRQRFRSVIGREPRLDASQLCLAIAATEGPASYAATDYIFIINALLCEMGQLMSGR
jgi:hypothetical protein